MSKIFQHPKIELNLTFVINEEEARALDAMVGYGYDSFIKCFKENLGKSYMNGHEEEFFESIRNFVPGYLEKLEQVKKSI
jgi:hypothetical protein